jgi:type I restriction enzyme S subunit
MITENQTHIPEGWKESELGAVIVEKAKSTIKVSEAANFGEYPFFTSGDSILLHDKKIIDGENLFLATGGVANIKYFDGEAAYSTDTFAISTNEDAKAQYLYYYLLSKVGYINKNYFEGSGLKHLQKKDFRKHAFVLPTSPIEQQKIASILSKLDEAITQTEQLIGKYKKIKEGLMHDLLTRGIDEQGNIRLEDTHKFKDSPLGRIPKEWECCEIGNACYVTKLSGFEFTKYMEYRDDGEIIAIRAMNIKNEQLILDDVQRISKKVSEFLVRSKLHSGDILITYIGAYIGDILQIKEDNKYHLAPNVAKIVGGPKLTPDFLEFMMRSTKVQRFIKSLVTTTANPSLTMGQIRTVYIIYPKDKKEQDRISKRLSTLNILINKTSSELEKLFLQKSGLMHDLLTGKIRVQI